MPEKAGHGSLVGVTLTPDASPGTFTTIPGLFCEIDWGWDSDTTDVTPHNKKIDVHVVSPVLKRPDRNLTLNYDHTDTTHIFLQNAAANKTKLGFRFTGPGATLGVHSDEVIESGFIKSWKIGNPLGSGARKVDLVWRATGAMIIDGVTYDEV